MATSRPATASSARPTPSGTIPAILGTGQTLDHEGFKDRVRTSRAPFPDQRFHLVSLLEDDGKVAVAWTWTATHRGDIPGFPATGRPLAMSGLTVYDFDADGLISGHWQVSDRLGIYGQLQAARQA